MRVLVTGGAGYLGAVLVPSLLRAGHRVTVVDSLLHGGESLLGVYHEGGFRFVKEDIRSLDNSAGVLDGVEAIVHLAAIVGDPACARQPDLARSVNYEASLGLFDLARRKGVQRFVFTSTCSNYGKMTAGSGFLDESSPLRPVSLYAETKVGVEQALLSGHDSNGPAVTVLRCSTLFGLSPRMRFDLTVNEFTKELLVKRKLLIFGKQFWRPYVHVLDVARAIMCVLESPPDRVAGEVYNVGDSGQNYQKGQIVELVRSNLDFDVDIEHVEKVEDPRDYRVAFDKIRDRLGYHISRTVEEGICEVRDAIRQGIFTDCESPRYHNCRDGYAQGLGVPAAASHLRRPSDRESRRAIILAGGKGTRLHPYSLLLPKPLMPIVDFPILEIELRQLRHYGFTDVTIAVGHLANLIIAFLGDGSQLGLRIRYAIEDVPRGTIGPLSAIPELREENRPFLLMNGDTLTDMNFAEFAKAHSDGGALVSVATYTKCLPIDLGVTEFDGSGRLTAFKEKPVIPFGVSMGIYAMSPPVLDHIPSNRPFGFDDLMHHCLQENLEVHGHRHEGIWLDIGRPDDYRAAIETFEKKRASFCPWERI